MHLPGQTAPCDVAGVCWGCVEEAAAERGVFELRKLGVRVEELGVGVPGGKGAWITKMSLGVDRASIRGQT